MAPHGANTKTSRPNSKGPTSKEKKDARRKALSLWKNAQRAPGSHSYLKRKGIEPGPCRLTTRGRIILPIKNASTRKFMAVQYIWPDGTKRYSKGAEKKGGCCELGELDCADIVYICEGFATGQTIYQVTDEAVAVALDCENLMPVALAIRKRFPDADIVLAADNDTQTAGNPGMAKAVDAAQAVKGRFAMPTTGGDFNDLMKVEGAAAVKKLLDGATEKAARHLLVSYTDFEFVRLDVPPRRNLVFPWLPDPGIAMIHASRGVGKTWLTQGLAHIVAYGGEFLGWVVEEKSRGGSIIADGEMPLNQMQERNKMFRPLFYRKGSPYHITFICDGAQPMGMPDLGTEKGQMLLDGMVTDDTKLITVDSIATCIRTGQENEAESWRTVEAWAKRHRANGRSVVFMHHSGKSGTQRGTSAREDVLDTVILLKRPVGYTIEQGAVFQIIYEKVRGAAGSDFSPVEVSMSMDEGDLSWEIRKLTETTAEQVIREVQSDPDVKSRDIAIALDISKGRVSQIRKQAEKTGELVMPKRKFRKRKV